MSEAGRSATIFGCSGPTLTDAERHFFRQVDPFGFILFARNIENPAQVSALTADLRASVGRDAPIFIDQEGGASSACARRTGASGCRPSRRWARRARAPSGCSGCATG